MTEQPWARKTILTVTDDFSGYTKDIPATINVYLTATATKPVATATLKVIDMPFNLVFFKTDHLGTPRVITDQDGKVLSTHDYLAYGEELTDPEFTTNRMKFTGHERDPETGLDYMLARYYSAGSGRFLQVDPGYDYDPMDPMSFNLYGYVRGNPVMKIDPTGTNWFKIAGKWQWHDGNKYTYKDDDDKEHTLRSNVKILVVYTVTSTDRNGARIGDITIYGKGKKDVIAQRKGEYIDVLVPPGVNPEANRQMAKVMANWFSLRGFQGLVEKYAWFYNIVKSDGEWGKYKLIDPKYENFGNWHYGRVGKAAGFPSEILSRAAGVAQRMDNKHVPKRWNTPCGSWPYGDDPLDSIWISVGMGDASYFRFVQGE